MRTAVLAVLVAAGVGMSAEDVAYNYDVDESAITERLRALESMGHVYKEGNLYYASGEAKSEITLRSSAKRHA